MKLKKEENDKEIISKINIKSIENDFLVKEEISSFSHQFQVINPDIKYIWMKIYQCISFYLIMTSHYSYTKIDRIKL